MSMLFDKLINLVSSAFSNCFLSILYLGYQEKSNDGRIFLSNISQFKLVVCLDNYQNNQMNFFTKFEVILLNLKIKKEKEDCYCQNGGWGIFIFVFLSVQ